MGRKSKKQLASAANGGGGHHNAFGKNPSILVVKFESSDCVLVDSDPFIPLTPRLFTTVPIVGISPDPLPLIQRCPLVTSATLSTASGAADGLAVTESTTSSGEL